MSNSTVTLQNVVNLASTHNDLRPLAGVGGYQNEPALSLCNDTLQELLSEPLDWKFNRVEMPFLVTSYAKQDYQFAGACAFTLGSTSAGAAIGLASGSAITVSGGVVTVNTLEAHTFNVGDTVYMFGNVATTGTSAKYNSTFTQTSSSSTYSGGWVLTAVTTTSFSFAATSGQNNADVAGAPGITDLGWLVEGTKFELNNNSSPQNIRPLQALRSLPLSSAIDNPVKVCVVKDNGDGTLKIRFANVPASTIWGVNLIYQAKAPLKTALTQTWSPFPDELGFVVRQGLLSRMYRYLNSPRADAEYQKLEAAINKALGANDREMSNTYIVPENSLLD